MLLLQGKEAELEGTVGCSEKGGESFHMGEKNGKRRRQKAAL